MQLDLGSKIRQLRRRDGRTQENLAAALGVTAQAVSRWESGGSYPDMNLIPPIANYFGVTIDELFGYTNLREQRVEKLVAEIDGMRRQNNGVDRNVEDCIAVARRALVEFPGNDRLMLCLASVLYTAGYVRYGEAHLIDEEGYSVYDVQRHRGYAEWEEAIPLYEKALETLENGKLRDRAMEELSQLYVNVGENGKALALAEAAPKMWNCRELLRPYAYDGKEQARAFAEALLHVTNSCGALVVHCTMACQNHMTPAEKARSVRGAIGLFELICPDGNYGEYHSFVSHLYLFLSLYLWLSGEQNKAFESLDLALEQFRQYVRVCKERKVAYTAPLVRLVKKELGEDWVPDPTDPSVSPACLPEDWPWWTVPEAERVRREMEADPRWAAWTAKTKE